MWNSTVEKAVTTTFMVRGQMDARGPGSANEERGPDPHSYARPTLATMIGHRRVGRPRLITDSP